MTSCSVSQNVDTELDQPPTSQARPRGNDHLRPSKLAARALRSVEHTPSKFAHDPCSVRRGLVVAFKCCVRKARFSRCPDRLWNRTREARALCGFQRHKGENLLPGMFYVFRSRDCRPDGTVCGMIAYDTPSCLFMCLCVFHDECLDRCARRGIPALNLLTTLVNTPSRALHTPRRTST